MKRELADVLREYGDVPRRRAPRARPAWPRRGAGTLPTTRALWSARGSRAAADGRIRAGIAQVFQALRIWINDEADDLDAMLQWLPEAMAAGRRGGDPRVPLGRGSPDQAGGARAAAHGLRAPPAAHLEERLPEGPWDELTRRVVMPSSDEVHRNPRARSARLARFPEEAAMSSGSRRFRSSWRRRATRAPSGPSCGCSPPRLVGMLLVEVWQSSRVAELCAGPRAVPRGAGAGAGTTGIRARPARPPHHPRRTRPAGVRAGPGAGRRPAGGRAARGVSRPRVTPTAGTPHRSRCWRGQKGLRARSCRRPRHGARTGN